MGFLLARLLACAATPADSGACDPEVDGWVNFGQGFLRQECQVCHASTAVDRHGAPPGVVFDTEADAWAHAPGILARAASDPPTMPPAGATRPEDRARLRRWLSCDPPASVSP